MSQSDDLEAAANKAVTSELLFELYNAPSVTYGIDSMFAFSRQGHQNGLALSLGNYASTVIPVVGGRSIISQAKRCVSRALAMDIANKIRLPWGGSQAAELMLRLVQLKYPAFPTKVTLPQATVSQVLRSQSSR